MLLVQMTLDHGGRAREVPADLGGSELGPSGHVCARYQ
jgi:hypothetical protein